MSFKALAERATCIPEFKLTDEEKELLLQFPEWERYYLIPLDEPLVFNHLGVIEATYTDKRVDFKPISGKGGRISGNYTRRCGLWLEVGSAKARICSANGSISGSDENGKHFSYHGWDY